MKKRRREAGLSTIDTLIGLAVGSILVVVTLHVFVSQVNTTSIHHQVVDMQENARIGLDVMLREIRMAGYDPTTAAGADLTEAIVDRIRFTRDINGNGDTADPDEDVIWALFDTDGDGDTDLGRSTDGATFEAVVDDIQALQFDYQLFDGTTTNSPANPSQVERVNVQIVAHKVAHELAQSNLLWTVSGSVLLRNKALVIP